jgi:CubicO group peptidase (beta-lactamase class C family)
VKPTWVSCASFAIGLLCVGSARLDARAVHQDSQHVADADQFLTRALSSNRIPGMSVCVVRHGAVLLAKGYGSANVELSVPATEHTVFELASLTKPFTAVAVLTLAEEGRISLQDRLTKYFPTAPSTWEPITVGELLSHTSGVGDFFSMPEFRSRSGFAWNREYDQAELLPLLFKVPILSPPGEKWSYSNLGYYLLGFIIEKVSGEPYADFLQERIFQPLGMLDTRRMSRRDIIPGRASGYTWENGVLKNAIVTSVTWVYAEGGLVSSVSDLAKATAGLFDDKLLKKATLDSMWQAYRLSDGRSAGYGMGWNIGSDPQRRQIYHSGNKPGFASIIRHYPDESLTIVVLMNVDNQAVANADADVGAISYRVAQLFLRPLASR